jgi:beta-barrel assembly-enhancing protease
MNAMMKKPWRVFLVCFSILIIFSSASAQTSLKPGFNIFSVEQDIDIGRQSAVEVEKQMPILQDPALQDYLTRVGQRLAAVAPGAKYPYQFKLVNVSDINAFALPGGFMYVNRGLIEVAHNEGELAGVMAHEISHVALRHGTNQASKASLAESGLALLLGGGGTLNELIGAMGGFGLNTIFLKFSRGAEEQADVMGTQIMTKAGYNPMDMVGMFDTLRQESGHDPTKLEKFFSDHPAPADRVVRIKKEISLLGSTPSVAPVGNFAQIKSRFLQMPKAVSLAQLQEQAKTKAGGQPKEGGSGSNIPLELPSATYRTYQSRDSLYQIALPENWQILEDPQGYGVTLVPQGGMIQAQEGNQVICGSILNVLDLSKVPNTSSNGPFSGKNRLEQATNGLLEGLLQNNSYLKIEPNSLGRTQLDRAPSLHLTLSGQSPTTGKTEKVIVQTREISQSGLLYFLNISQESQPAQIAEVFKKMSDSLQVQK